MGTSSLIFTNLILGLSGLKLIPSVIQGLFKRLLILKLYLPRCIWMIYETLIFFKIVLLTFLTHLFQRVFHSSKWWLALCYLLRAMAMIASTSTLSCVLSMANLLSFVTHLFFLLQYLNFNTFFLDKILNQNVPLLFLLSRFQDGIFTNCHLEKSIGLSWTLSSIYWLHYCNDA